MPGSGSRSACSPPQSPQFWSASCCRCRSWGASITALLVCSTIYFRQVIRNIQASGRSAPTLKLTILPVTLTAVAVLFIFIIARRSPDLPTRMAGAIIGAIAAPMIFELPFDPIVIFRFHMVVPGPPRGLWSTRRCC